MMVDAVARQVRPRHLRVLLVDDDSLITTFFARLLERLGYLVETASDGGLALQRIRHLPFDIIVCDFAMSGLDGITFYHALIRERPELQSRFILLTAYPEHRALRAFIAETGVRMVTKPCSAVALDHVIEEMLSGPPP